MKLKLMTRLLLLAGVLNAFAPVAQAFYNPSTGRWLNRDPIDERGGANLYRFVDNNALIKIDPRGQIPIIIPIVIFPLLFSGCSKGDCVCEGKKVKAKPIETGVVTHKWTGTPDATGRPTHSWLTWNGGTADANSYALLIQPGDKKVSSPAGATPAPSDGTPLKLSPCKYDFRKLNACLTELAASMHGQVFGMCWDLPPYLIDACKEKSKGCTPPP